MGLSLLVFGGACGSQTQQKEVMSFSDFAKIESAIQISPVEAPLDCTTSECKGYRQEFRYVVYVGQKVYCYWEEKKAEVLVPFEQLAQDLEVSINDQTSLSQYYQILRRWAASFHDGHVNVMAGDMISNLEIYTAPLRLEVLAPATDHEKVIVSSTTDPSLARVGEQVVSVNGVDVSKAIDQAEVFASGSTKRMRRRSSTKLLVDAMGAEAGMQPLTLGLLDPKGQPRTIQVPHTIDLSLPPSSNAPSAPEETGEKLVQASVLPGGIGVLRIDGFSGSRISDLLANAMDRLSGTRGLLIDVRKNGGGDQSANIILARMTSQPSIRYLTSERVSDFTLAMRPGSFWFSAQMFPGKDFADWHKIRIPEQDSAKYMGKPVYVLTSPYCFSACDTFTSAMKVNKFATIVGEATGGGTGSPLVFDLPISEMQFRYSVVRGRTALGQPLEGAGTQPDILLEPTIDERVQGKDLQFAKAADLLRAAIDPAAGASAPSVVDANPYIDLEDEAKISPTRLEQIRLKAIMRVDEL